MPPTRHLNIPEIAKLLYGNDLLDTVQCMLMYNFSMVQVAVPSIAFQYVRRQYVSPGLT